jgi:hypothetical protein
VEYRCVLSVVLRQELRLVCWGCSVNRYWGYLNDLLYVRLYHISFLIDSDWRSGWGKTTDHGGNLILIDS